MGRPVVSAMPPPSHVILTPSSGAPKAYYSSMPAGQPSDMTRNDPVLADMDRSMKMMQRPNKIPGVMRQSSNASSSGGSSYNMPACENV